MEIKWLHDGNLEEEKQRLEFIKHVWGKIESLTQCLCLQCGNLQLCSPKLYYTCVYIYVCVCVCVCVRACVCVYIYVWHSESDTTSFKSLVAKLK